MWWRFQDFRDASVEMRHRISEAEPGRTVPLTLKRDGQGRVYYAARLHYAPKVLPTTPINAGMTIHREYSVERHGEWVHLQNPIQLQQGELVRVNLYLSLYRLPETLSWLMTPCQGGWSR